jgi:hypothetical protein
MNDLYSSRAENQRPSRSKYSAGRVASRLNVTVSDQPSFRLARAEPPFWTPAGVGLDAAEDVTRTG